MSEIWNLSALCRCCHKDGHFKSLHAADECGDCAVYSEMLRDNLGIVINPPLLEVSYSICDECIVSLRNAVRFKQQVLECEHKFDEYCKNEQAYNIPAEFVMVKMEIEADHDVNLVSKEQIKGEDIYKRDSNSPHQSSELRSQPVLAASASTGHESLSSDVLGEPTFTCETYIFKMESNSPPHQSSEFSSQPSASTEHRQVRGESLSSDVLGEPTFTCETCKEHFRTQGELVKHINTHAIISTCGICKKHKLTNHRNTSSEKRPFSCDICKKSFIKVSNLKEHEYIHTEEKPYACDICSKRFIRKSRLVDHKRSHTEEKLSCDICKKQFTQKHTLVQHQRIHTGQKQYTCQFCAKQFYNKTNLIAHHRTHTGEKPFPCGICNKSFSSKFQAELHMRTHTGNKPCDLCGKQCTTKVHLIHHRRTHTGEKLFCCDVCPKQFVQKSNLKRHVASIHKRSAQ